MYVPCTSAPWIWTRAPPLALNVSVVEAARGVQASTLTYPARSRLRSVASGGDSTHPRPIPASKAVFALLCFPLLFSFLFFSSSSFPWGCTHHAGFELNPPEAKRAEHTEPSPRFQIEPT